MSKPAREQRLIETLQEYAAHDVPPSLDLWPAIRAAAHPAPRPRPALVVARAVTVMALLVAVGLAAYAVAPSPGGRPGEATPPATYPTAPAGLPLSQTVDG